MDEARYYRQTRTNALLRHQANGRDEFYGSAAGKREPTNDVMAYMAGEDMDVEELTEAQACVQVIQPITALGRIDMAPWTTACGNLIQMTGRA
jgi:hypothetical protein